MQSGHQTLQFVGRQWVKYFSENVRPIKFFAAQCLLDGSEGNFGLIKPRVLISTAESSKPIRAVAQLLLFAESRLRMAPALQA